MPVSAGSLQYAWYYCDKDGSIIFTTYISNFGIFDEEPSEYVREDYEILGIFYEKAGGTPYEGETLTEETTLYVQWESTTGVGTVEPQPELEPEPELREKDDTPKTGNDLQVRENMILILLMSIFSIVVITKFRKK